LTIADSEIANPKSEMGSRARIYPVILSKKLLTQRRKEMSYFRDNIQQMEGYSPGFQPHHWRDEGWIKLNTNEDPFPPSPKVLEALREAIDGRIRFYPDSDAKSVREAVARVYGVDEECVIVGNGCDEVLSIAARAVLGEGEVMLMTRPTYTLYRVLGHIQGAKVLEVPLNSDFSLREEFFSQKAKLTFISNPNPPSGILYEKADMERLCEESGGVVVIDEAYADFADRNCLGLVEKQDNLVITRSLSKYMSLAGLRIGFGIASRDLIGGMKKVKDSYNVNCLSQVAAAAALDDVGYYSDKMKEIRRERDSLTEKLRQLGWKVFPSHANFIFALPAQLHASEMYEELFRKKILVRYFDTPETKDGLRITIGNPEENRRLLEVIRAIIGGEKE